MTEYEFDTWLNRKPDETYALVRQYPVDPMQIVQIGIKKMDKLGIE